MLKSLLLLAVLATSVLIAACGGGETTVVTVVREVPVEKEVMREVPREGVRDVAPTPAPGRPAPSASDAAEESFEGEQERAATQAIQERMIVRTVNMALVVADVSKTSDDILGIATSLGGWVVSAERSQVHLGSIAIRVPAERLDDAVNRVRDLAEDVESQISTSQDVTDEYVDNASRIKNLETTRDALARLMEKAVKVEDALKVQQELTRIQEEIEVLQGRNKLLQETSAYSLINVNLRTKPREMPIDAGPDQTVGLGQAVRFRATFRPPDGIEEFSYIWIFGDGSVTDTRYSTAPTTEEGTRVTATVTHVYRSEKDSPYIAEVVITGTGKAGIVEARDVVIVTVTTLPTIEVFAGENQTVQEGEVVQLAGTFTHPVELTDATYTWDFGDGSAVATGSVEPGVTRAAVSHVYEHHRPRAFTATLTIKGESKAGPVETSATVIVQVLEAQGWTIGGWDFGNTWKSAVRALSGLGIGLGYVAIWILIFSPLWIIGGLIALWLRRRSRTARPKHLPPPPTVSDASLRSE